MKTTSKFKPVPLYRDEFEALNELPNESTLETNVTHKQLLDFKKMGSETVALSPTRYDEGRIGNGGGPLGKGYDIRFEHAREIVFQHKAPKKTVVRGEDNKNKRLWLQYNIDFAQLLNLAIQYQPQQAYLALPLIPTQNWLQKSLSMTVFIDVWTLYSGIQRYGLCPDYILVEFLPDWSRGWRPAFDPTGQLTPDEYFRERPVIKCKHKCDKWGMKASNSDPYIELSLGESAHAQSVRWGTLKKSFQEKPIGLKITSSIRSDGGNSLPDDWPYLELPERYSAEYREHIKRRYALSRLGRQYNEPNLESLLQWILDDLRSRYERAVEMQMIEPLFLNKTEEALPEDVYAHKTSPREILERFVNKPNPETYKLGNSKRLIIQSDYEENYQML